MMGIKRETAYKMAVEALIEARRKFAFDYNINRLYPGASNVNAIKNYDRITEAIGILETEKEHKQMELFE